MRFTDSDQSARQLLQILLLELGLSPELAELDRRGIVAPAFLQELKARALRYLAENGGTTTA